MRIVLASSNSSLLDKMRKVLTPHHDLVGQAENMMLLLQKILQLQPELVIFDLETDTEVNLLRSIRSNAAIRPAKLILISRKSGEHDQLVALAAGADCVVHAAQVDASLLGAIESMGSTPQANQENPEIEPARFPARPSIVLADDDDQIRSLLSELLSEHYELVGAAGDGIELISLARLFRPHIVVSDISMPRLNGIQAARSIQAESIESKVILCSTFASTSYLKQALKAGVSGYVLKTLGSEELMKAIAAVLKGNTFISEATWA